MRITDVADFIVRVVSEGCLAGICAVVVGVVYVVCCIG